jgi:hypothetical protein
MTWVSAAQGVHSPTNISGLTVAYCTNCTQRSVWQGKTMVFPGVSSAPLPHKDMPDEIESEYNEARNVVSISPRAAAALIRLAVQKLMPLLGGEGENINDDIKKLVETGLPERIQRALDSLRVIGNNAVHPGQIDLEDDVKTALALFYVLNIIIEDRISKDKQIDELYEMIPESTRDAIERRDT